MLVETRLGVSLEDAMEGVAERFDSKDFEWVVMAIKIQRQVGGNLAELLDTVAATMREREYVRRQVAALAAEGKLSAWVLGGLPPLFMVYLLLTNYDYVIVMFQEPLGWAMLAGAATILGDRGVLDEPTGQGGGVRWPCSSSSASRLVFLAIILIGSALSTSTQSGVTRSLAVLEAMTNAPKELTKELEKLVRRAGARAAAGSAPWASAAGSPAPTPRSGSVASSTWPATRRAGRSTACCPAR